MEDYVLIEDGTTSNEPWHLFGLFDGHGGIAASQFCSQKMGKIIREQMDHCEDPILLLKSAFHQVNELFREYVQNGDPTAKYLIKCDTCCINDVFRHAGTTALIILLYRGKLWVANVGDTKAVLCRNGIGIQLTLDHKPTSEEDRINALVLLIQIILQ
jgi:serine/threonine protein phosphatase PrpC